LRRNEDAIKNKSRYPNEKLKKQKNNYHKLNRRIMSQKVALVTGANKGIGYETAKQLAKEGVTVIAAARNEAKGKAAAEELKQQGLKVEFLKLDVDNDADIDAAYDYINNKYGQA
jgi:NAD(P)-dependent dehydrogenase (short-subunit alcohol dehydrogenase family)